MGTPLAIPLIDGSLRQVEKRTSWPVGLWHGELLKQPKMAVWGKITPLRVHFQNSSRFNTGQRLTFSPEFHADLSRYKEMRANSLYPLQINSHLLTAILRPSGPGRKNFNTWDLTSASTHACKILSGSVKACRSYSSYYSKQVYWICLYSWFICRQKY